MQPIIDIKREEFRKYLEHAGVLDSLTNILIALYEEQDKPDDGTEYPFKFLITIFRLIVDIVF